jgi:hypothetical protein
MMGWVVRGVRVMMLGMRGMEGIMMMTVGSWVLQGTKQQQQQLETLIWQMPSREHQTLTQQQQQGVRLVLGMICLTGCRVRAALPLLLLLLPGRGVVLEGGPAPSLLLLVVTMRGVTLTPMRRWTLLLLDPCLSSRCRWAVTKYQSCYMCWAVSCVGMLHHAMLCFPKL